jgi:RimJ/RimL family protein N-acetyltransferase
MGTNQERLLRPRLRTRRLVIQPLQPRHAGQLFEAVAGDRAWLRRWLPFADRTRTRAETLGFIQRMSRGGQNIVWGIWMPGDHPGRQDRRGGIRGGEGHDGQGRGTPSRAGTYCGTIGLHRIDRDQGTAVLGYWVRRAVAGQGIATEGCAAVLLWAFGSLGLARVTVEVATGNASSLKVAAKLGFVREGRLRDAQCLPGRRRRVDWFIHGLVRRDLRRARRGLAARCGTRRPWAQPITAARGGS